MSKPFPLLCRDCIWSYDHKDHPYLRCIHPKVNANDIWALSAKQHHNGSTCIDERKKRIFAACGRKGKLWESNRVS